MARYDHEQMVWLSLEGQDELSVVTDQALGGPEKGRLIFMNILDYSLFFRWASWEFSDRLIRSASKSSKIFMATTS